MKLAERLRQPVTLPRLGRRDPETRAARAPEGESPADQEAGAERPTAVQPAPSRTVRLPRGSRGPRAGAPVVGVRLDVDAVRVAAATVEAGRPVLRGHARASLPERAVRDGEVADPMAVGAALRAAVDRLGAGDRVRFGVANQRVAARTVLIPPVEDPREIEAAVRFVAGDQLPVPLDGAVIDGVPLDVVDTPEGARRRVLVVAARSEMIDGLLAAAEAAKVRVAGIDLGAFALTRALPRTGSRLIVDIGGVTTLAVAEGRHCGFVRTIGAGLESAAAELADRHAVPPEDALAAIAEAEPRGGEGAMAEPATEVLDRTLRAICATVRHSLDFHRAEQPTGAPAVDVCLLTGPLSRLPGVVDLVEAEIGLTVEPGRVDPQGDADVLAAGLCFEETPA